MRKLIASIVLSLTIGSVQSQNNWNWNQYHYFADSNFTSGGAWGSINYHILSNHLTNELTNQVVFDGKVLPYATEFIDEYASSGYTMMSAGSVGEVWVRPGNNKKWRPIFGLGYRDVATATLKTGLVQHYLRGNGPYEDEEIDLGPSELSYHSYQFFGVGLEHTSDKTQWGATAQLIKSSRYAQLSMGSSSIYTAPFGSSIEADLNFRYDYTSTEQGKLGAWYGTGYSINAFFQHQANTNGVLINFQLRDFGQIFYEGINRWKLNDSLTFNGLEANNILQLDDSLVNGGELDSLEALLGLQRAHPFRRVGMPVSMQVNYVHPIGKRFSINVQLRQFLTFGLPEFRVGFVYRPQPWIAFEPTIRAGGMSRVDLGLSVAINAGNRFLLLLKTEQFENLVAPDRSTSQYLSLATQLKF